MDTNNYIQLEDEIISRLAPLVDQGIEVEPLPDNEEDTTEPFEKPRITVAYKNSEFSQNIVRGLPDLYSTSEAVQDEFAEFVLVVSARSLRGELGIHKVSKLARDLVFGWSPSHFGRCFLKMHGFAEPLKDKESGVWIYQMVFVCRGMVIQAFADDPTSYPLLEQTTFNHH